MEYFDYYFYFFSFIVLASAAVVVFSKNLLYAAVGLLTTLVGISGLFFLLDARFLAFIQVLVYVGGVLVFIVYGIMLTNRIRDLQFKTEFHFVIPALVLTGILAGFIIKGAMEFREAALGKVLKNIELNQIALILFNDYLIVFEILGLLLLVILIAASSIARK
ncbi:MAG: NADH-quinone oxidoreductase subunit J [Ignavibacteriaceae bacterium]|nr:NADH-quinone oxidoreductase subunit J [Ignavibacteriaceae bacterium]NUM69631.1 NADH-quinone oxidoreductase subunit J [Ignavibacteriaceae bacterium]